MWPQSHKIWRDLGSRKPVGRNLQITFENRPASRTSDRRGPRSQERILHDWSVNFTSEAGLIKHAWNSTPPRRDAAGEYIPFGYFIQRVSQDAQMGAEWNERGRNLDTVVAIEENVRRHRETRE